jgi:glycosyltransferase involved in cell wall biosynthesis
MKLGIVIPLKAKVVSRDWAITSACLEQTVKCLERQTSHSWEAIVVGHDQPDFFKSAPLKTRFAIVDTPSPIPPVDGYRKVDWNWIRERAIDRNRKIIRGMQLLRDEGIDYWYYLDGDDLLHREFVARLAAIDLKAGAVLHEGYLWYPRSKRVIPYSNMPIICGSTVIIRAANFEIPKSLDIEELGKVPYCRYNHVDLARYFDEECNGQYVNVMDRLLAYSVGHGDNTSDGFRDTFVKRLKSWAKPYIRGRRIDSSTLCDFSLA